MWSSPFRIYRYVRLFLVCHDVEHDAVGLVHAVATDACEVEDSLVDVVVNDAFHGRYTFAFHCQQGCQDG